MKIITEIQSVWKSLTKSAQRKLNADSMNYPDGGCDANLSAIWCVVTDPKRSPIYPGVAARKYIGSKIGFVAEGLGGLVDHREDNGQTKADET